MSGLFTFKNDGHVVRRDSFDQDAYDRAAEAIPDLAQLEDDFSSKTKHGRELLEDLHSSLFKQEPTLLDPGSLNKTLAQHHGLLEQLYQTTEFQSWHGQTQFDHVRSALGTVELAKAMLADKLPADEDERRRVLRSMIKKAEGQVEEQIEAFETLNGPLGEGSLGDLTDVVKAGDALARSGYLRKLIEKAGRLVRIAQTKHRARVRHGPDEIVDMELGADLERVLPSELAYLSHPILGLETLRRYAERELLQYRIDGTEPLGRGPIVVCVDTSGSMRAEGKEFWAKGIALGLMSIAVEEGRKFVLINFSGPHEQRKFEVEGRPPLDQLAKALEYSFDGGTDFMAPLEQSLKIIEGSKFKNADMIMITDGEAYVSEEWVSSFKKRKAAKCARLFSVLIGFNSTALTPISDGVERIDDLADDEAVTDLVFGGI